MVKLRDNELVLQFWLICVLGIAASSLPYLWQYSEAQKQIQ